jgi:hypothetical protein
MREWFVRIKKVMVLLLSHDRSESLDSTRVVKLLQSPFIYGNPDCQASKSVAKHLAAINAEAVSTDRLF